MQSTSRIAKSGSSGSSCASLKNVPSRPAFMQPWRLTRILPESPPLVKPLWWTFLVVNMSLAAGSFAINRSSRWDYEGLHSHSCNSCELISLSFPNRWAHIPPGRIRHQPCSKWGSMNPETTRAQGSSHLDKTALLKEIEENDRQAKVLASLAYRLGDLEAVWRMKSVQARHERCRKSLAKL